MLQLAQFEAEPRIKTSPERNDLKPGAFTIFYLCRLVYVCAFFGQHAAFIFENDEGRRRGIRITEEACHGRFGQVPLIALVRRRMTLHSLFVHLGANLISGVHDDSTSRSTSFCALRMDSSSPRVQHVVPASFFEASLLVRHPESSTYDLGCFRPTCRSCDSVAGVACCPVV